MNMSIHKIVLNNLTLKIVAFIIAYGCWSLLNQSRIVQIETNVPLCFYNGKTTDTISAPETIAITLAGKATDMRSLNFEQIACHINMAELHAGDNPLRVTKETLFLPESINLVHYYPSNGCIIMHTTSLQSDTLASPTHNKEQNIT